jgi:hypothetical protein
MRILADLTGSGGFLPKCINSIGLPLVGGHFDDSQAAHGAWAGSATLSKKPQQAVQRRATAGGAFAYG